MSSNPSFTIRLNAADSKILADFKGFLEQQSIDKIEVSLLVEEFTLSVLPQIRRIRTLTRNRSNVDFSRLFETTRGSIEVELSSNSRNLFQRFYAFLGR